LVNVGLVWLFLDIAHHREEILFKTWRGEGIPRVNPRSGAMTALGLAIGLVLVGLIQGWIYRRQNREGKDDRSREERMPTQQSAASL
jgi:hypothetical protein